MRQGRTQKDQPAWYFDVHPCLPTKATAISGATARHLMIFVRRQQQTTNDGQSRKLNMTCFERNKIHGLKRRDLVPRLLRKGILRTFLLQQTWSTYSLNLPDGAQ